MMIRKAIASDATAANEIYLLARKYMKDSGNPDQWNGEYPGIRDIIDDIANESSYVCVDGDEIIGVFHFHIGKEPTYHKIYDGEWKNSDDYGTIHRIAVKYHGRKIADFIYSECFKLCGNLKIDTHRDNLPMQKSLAKCGFEYCGIIYLESGDERLAYQKTK